jgi:NADH-quinone oxidoreductase subunit F
MLAPKFPAPPEPRTLNPVPSPMPSFEPVLLARIAKPNSAKLETYRADGGYEALKKALAMAPADVTTLVKDSVLRGRGGAGFLPD